MLLGEPLTEYNIDNNNLTLPYALSLRRNTRIQRGTAAICHGRTLDPGLGDALCESGMSKLH